MSMSKTLNGKIIKGIGGFYYVEAANQVYECKARGVFRKEKTTPLCGDVVTISVNDGAENTIDEIHPRKNQLMRPPVANIDSLIIVASTVKPRPSTLVIDKLTAVAEHKNIEPVIIVTKDDLAPADELVSIYKHAGFVSVAVSNETGEGVGEVRKLLCGKTSAFTGNSGVGKTSLLNRIAPELKLATSAISEKLGRGRHTTREAEFFSAAGGYIADTPGFSSLELAMISSIDKQELAYCFREFRKYLGSCKFTTCSHTCDKGCKIVEAVKNGDIEKSRHESYKAIYNEIKDIKEWQK